jgi:hypothetical protein
MSAEELGRLTSLSERERHALHALLSSGEEGQALEVARTLCPGLDGAWITDLAGRIRTGMGYGLIWPRPDLDADQARARLALLTERWGPSPLSRGQIGEVLRGRTQRVCGWLLRLECYNTTTMRESLRLQEWRHTLQGHAADLTYRLLQSEIAEVRADILWRILLDLPVDVGLLSAGEQIGLFAEEVRA